MAEGIQLVSFKTKYHCHHCCREVSPFHTAELICPDCSSKFLEEVSEDLSSDATYSCPDDKVKSDLEDVSNLSLPPNTTDVFHRMSMNAAEELPEENEPAEPRRADSFSDETRHISIRESLNTGLVSPSRSFRSLVDFSDEEIDDFASLLLDELQLSGPPKPSKDLIKSLPSFQITADLLEKGMQCSVCMDDFSLQDKAKCLPCSHLYHEKCITPWLEKHTTCPNCREVVQVQSKNRQSGDNRQFPEALVEYYKTRFDPFRFLYEDAF
ncbi:E3 ubiquitin-protein ligase RNF126 [Araneus ventricosus]|uniref:RING-type E3 ubiquitin transferase n=1 Tax=Araneus ventricosus TaxID=182803 RepID=A0A4Y2MFN9_ARAVE|nr:E3 ubiquitin-protein ligase RNF126 [Araneus ventricosus]